MSELSANRLIAFNTSCTLISASPNTDPTGGPILPVFFFPNGGIVFEGVDRVFAGGEGFGAVGATDRH